MPAEMNPLFAQVNEVLTLMGKRADHLDDLPSSRETNPADVAKIWYPVFRYLMDKDGNEIWSAERIIGEAMDKGLDGSEPFGRFCRAMLDFVNNLDSRGFLEVERHLGAIGSETKFFINNTGASAYEFLADLAQSAGEERKRIDEYRRYAQLLRKS